MFVILTKRVHSKFNMDSRQKQVVLQYSGKELIDRLDLMALLSTEVHSYNSCLVEVMVE